MIRMVDALDRLCRASLCRRMLCVALCAAFVAALAGCGSPPSLTSSADPSAPGQPVTFTATVTTGAGNNPTGPATFKDGTTTLGAVAFTGGFTGPDTATYTTSALTHGSHSITVTYPSSFGTVTIGPLTQYVGAFNTTALASNLNPSSYGQSVTLTATVTPAAGTPAADGAPTGAITFKDGATILGAVALAPVSPGATTAQATLTTSALGAGSHALTAAYPGDGTFVPSSGSLTQTVTGLAATVGLASSLNPSVYGQPATITATVASAGGTGTPTGSVTFTVDGVARPPVTLSGGQATLDASGLSAGSHAITAAYSGDGVFAPAAAGGPLTQIVTQAATTTALTSTANPFYGRGVAFTATVAPVSPGAGTPTGAVTFTIDGTAQTPVTLSGGQATLTPSDLAPGRHTVTASYAGDVDFTGSASGTLTQTVAQAATTTTLASGVDPSVYGQPVTLTATVAPVSPGVGTPTGTVTFTVDGVARPPVTLSGGQATLDASGLSVGAHTASASYAGDADFTGSGSSSPLTQTVAQAATTTALTSSANPSVYGQAVTVTATVAPVSPGAGTPTGAVTFTIDGTAQTPVTLSGGQAISGVPGLGAGVHTVTATYAGDTDFTGSASGILSQKVRVAQPSLVVTGAGDDAGSVAPDAQGRVPTLRDAVAYADALPGTRIIFDPTAFAAPQTITLTSGALPLSADVTVQGPAAGVTIDGGGRSGGFTVSAGSANLSGLTLQQCVSIDTSGQMPVVQEVVAVSVSPGASASLTGCTLEGNAGGVINEGTVTLTGCTLTNNEYFSGVINQGTATLTGCVLAGNSNGFGGALANQQGAATLTDCTLDHNSAEMGGGVYNFNGTVTLTNCVLTDNRVIAGGNGGGVLNEGTGTLTGCTLSGNSAPDGQGGALYTIGSSTLTDDILYGDSASRSPEIANGGVTASHCDIQGGYGGTGNIDADPLFVSAATGDFHLQPGSPCLGAGIAVVGLTTDRDGLTRPDPPGIGAYDAPSVPTHSWTARGVSTGADGYSRLLWDKSDGTATVWKVSPAGSLLTQRQFGPYAGWTAKALATGRDNRTRLLWTNTDGTASYYLLDADGSFLSQQQYGPYQGWTAQGLAVETDGTTRALWTNADGTATVWTLDADNVFVSQQQFGPYQGWTAKSLTVNPDGTERLLWTNTDGTAAFWHLTGSSRLIDQHQYGPYTGYTAKSIVASPDGTGRAAWIATDGHIALWTLDGSNAYTGQSQFGPYAGWSFQSLGVGSDGNARLLWDNVSGQAALWSITPGGAFAANTQYGPY